jgi:hypothetical protein
MEMLRAAGHDVNSRWLEFRRVAFQRELERTLEEGGVEATAARQLSAEIAETRFRPRQRTDAELPISISSTPPKDQPLGLVHLVQRIVSHMREDELRRLRLPLGLVLDAISERSNQ